jgi:hypothetical protein
VTGVTPGLAGAELVFAQRMLPHFLAGMSPEESAHAVLADDARIVTAFFRRGQSHYYPTPDERGRSHRTADREGDLIAHELSRQVHTAIARARGEG